MGLLDLVPTDVCGNRQQGEVPFTDNADSPLFNRLLDIENPIGSQSMKGEKHGVGFALLRVLAYGLDEYGIVLHRIFDAYRL